MSCFAHQVTCYNSGYDICLRVKVGVLNLSCGLRVEFTFSHYPPTFYSCEYDIFDLSVPCDWLASWDRLQVIRNPK